MSNSQFRKPNLEFYRKKAKQLVKSHREGDPRSLSLIKYNHGRFTTLELPEIAERKFSLRDAQTVVARVDGYEGWSQLRNHVQALNSGSDHPSLLFEQAAEAIVSGNHNVLQRLLQRHPELIKARSRRQHRSTLLHYIAANGIEHHRQRTPSNAVEIAELLLENGAAPDATAGTYGGGDSQTTLALLVSSGWPYQAGLQGKLVKTLCRFGANPDGIQSNGLPLATALVFFYGETAKALAECGASVQHLLAAMSVGTPDDVDACFTARGRLRKQNFVYIGFQLRRPQTRLEMLGQAFAYAALCGNLSTMKHLASNYGCPVDAPADRGIRALHLAAYRGHGKAVDWLLERGADPRILDQQWRSPPAVWAQQSGQARIRRSILRSMDAK